MAAPSTAPTAPAAAAPSSAGAPATAHDPASPRHGIDGRASHAKRSHKRADGQGAARAPIATGRGAVAATVTPTSTGAASAGSPAGRVHHAAPARPAVAVRSSPITTTITRIVGVVPAWLWVLIGALAALALALAVRTRLAAVRARRLERQRSELLADVGLLQAALLPAPPARLGPVGTSVAYRPAAGPGAGGDFYDVFALDDGRLGVIVGDVSGHGRPALPHTALVRYTLRAYLEAGLSPRETLQTAGSVLARQLGGSFVTVVTAIYHPRERTLTYACAGHPPPIVLGAQPVEPVTACAAPPLGAGMRTGTRQTVLSVPGEAKLCFYTDGVTEARVGAAGELYGTARLAAVVDEMDRSGTAEELLDRVITETDARPDDMAACLLSVAGDASPPVALSEAIEIDREADGDRTERFLDACGVTHETVGYARSAHELAQRSGGAILEVSFAGAGTPHVALQADNVAPLHHRSSTQRRAGGTALI